MSKEITHPANKDGYIRFCIRQKIRILRDFYIIYNYNDEVKHRKAMQQEIDQHPNDDIDYILDKYCNMLIRDKLNGGNE